MVKSSRVINTFPIFYGWVVLGVGAIGSMMIGPSQTFTVGIFSEFFRQDLQLSRSSVSLMYGFATLSASFLLPLMGRLVDQYGTRRMVIFVALGLGLACFGMGLINGLFTMFLGMFALRFFGFGSLQLVSNNLIAQWFIRRRGLVMGVAGQSLAVGLLIFPIITEYFIAQFGWRGAWRMLGLLVWLIMLPLGWLFFRDKPEQYGLFPDGETIESLRRRDPTAQFAIEDNWRLVEARRTGAFWLFAVALSNMSMMVAGLMFHQISLFEQQGLSQSIAIRAFQMVAFFSIIGNLGGGYLLDKISARLLLTLVLIVQMGAMVLAQSMSTSLQGLIYAALIGVVSGAFRVLDSTIWAKYFGRQYLGEIRGATMIGVVGATALAPYLLGLSYDRLGSYAPALNFLLIIPITICVLAAWVKRPQKVNLGRVS